MQKDLRKTGYIEYIDDTGLTAKATKAKLITTQITKITKILEKEFHGFNIRLIRNPTTVVSRSNFSNLSEILQDSLNLWKQIDYPFIDELLIRTSNFEQTTKFSLPNITIPLNPESIVDDVEANMEELNNPDQILLHPRLSNENLKKLMIGARFLSGSTKSIIDIGGKGIYHIYDLEKADSVYRGCLADEVQIDRISGRQSDHIVDLLEKLLKVATFLNPVATNIIVPSEKHHKNIVFEYRIIENDSELYLDFNDYEVI